jgi:hypothetical protein
MISYFQIQEPLTFKASSGSKPYLLAELDLLRPLRISRYDKLKTLRGIVQILPVRKTYSGVLGTVGCMLTQGGKL